MKRHINRSVYVEVRLWNDKANGTTYHSLRLWVDGGIVGGVGGLTYGSDRASYDLSATNKLVELGYITGEWSAWLEAQRQGFDYYTSETWVKKSEMWREK